MAGDIPILTGNIAADAAADAAAGRGLKGFVPLHRPGTTPMAIHKRAAGRLTGEPEKDDAVATLRKATQDFEAVFLALTLKQIRSTIEKDEFLNGGMGEEIFTEMLDQQLAEKTASSGTTGIAQMLFRQLSRQYLGAQDAGNADGAGMPGVSHTAGALMRKLQASSAGAAFGAASQGLPDL